MKDFNYYNTLLVQNIGSKVGPVAPTIVPSAAFGYEDVQTENRGDNRTLALHMTSMIYSDFDVTTRHFLGVDEGFIRVSIGLEEPELIANDFLQAANEL